MLAGLGRGGAEDLVVERSGGFGGLVLRGSFAWDQLSPEQRGAVEACLGGSTGSGGPAGADRFVYQLRWGGREATVQEQELPAPLQPLTRRLALASI
ncbi:MAG: hypothetical protein M3024_04735 [Candidatus Dormibacteraeota bacterium]|nr:hypothetical protein [Candidatus Dormibacteraeota bacterium]